MSMPAQNPGRSRQDYSTPPELLLAIKDYLWINHFSIDLAASDANKVAPLFYDEATNALADEHPWCVDENDGGWAYANPPYFNIRPWVEKAYHEATNHGAQIAMLVPASTGSNWWADWVHDKANVLLMQGRVRFVGASGPYPKDTVILLYAPHIKGGYTLWDWKA